jgi:hypothetical protein
VDEEEVDPIRLAEFVLGEFRMPILSTTELPKEALRMDDYSVKPNGIALSS